MSNILRCSLVSDTFMYLMLWFFAYSVYFRRKDFCCFITMWRVRVELQHTSWHTVTFSRNLTEY